MNTLLHIATFVAMLWLSSLFYEHNLDVLGWVIIIMAFWIGILTILAVWEDVSKLFSRDRG